MEHPVGRDAALFFIGPQCVNGRHISPAQLKHRVEIIWSDWHIVSSPGKELVIETFCSRLIAGSQLHPAEGSRLMSIQVWHQPESGRIASKLQAVGDGERREGLGLDVPGATGISKCSWNKSPNRCSLLRRTKYENIGSILCDRIDCSRDRLGPKFNGYIKTICRR